MATRDPTGDTWPQHHVLFTTQLTIAFSLQAHTAMGVCPEGWQGSRLLRTRSNALLSTSHSRSMADFRQSPMRVL